MVSNFAAYHLAHADVVAMPSIAVMSPMSFSGRYLRPVRRLALPQIDRMDLRPDLKIAMSEPTIATAPTRIVFQSSTSAAGTFQKSGSNQFTARRARNLRRYSSGCVLPLLPQNSTAFIEV